MSEALTVDAAFERDIPAEERDNVMQMICERNISLQMFSIVVPTNNILISSFDRCMMI